MNTKFKVGNRVKIINKVWWIDQYFTNEVGIVTNIDRNSGFQYTVSIGAYKIAVHGHEIELMAKVGEQLLFSFMEGI